MTSMDGLLAAQVLCSALTVSGGENGGTEKNGGTLKREKKRITKKSEKE